MLIVMPDGNVTGAQGFGENTLRMFERELKQCIIPFVEKNYRTETRFKEPCTCRFIDGWNSDSLCRNQ